MPSWISAAPPLGTRRAIGELRGRCRRRRRVHQLHHGCALRSRLSQGLPRPPAAARPASGRDPGLCIARHDQAFGMTRPPTSCACPRSRSAMATPSRHGRRWAIRRPGSRRRGRRCSRTLCIPSTRRRSTSAHRHQRLSRHPRRRQRGFDREGGGAAVVRPCRRLDRRRGRGHARPPGPGLRLSHLDPAGDGQVLSPQPPQVLRRCAERGRAARLADQRAARALSGRRCRLRRLAA
jgi:hypothetical protein